MALHKDLTGESAIHQSAYVQSADPGAVGALKAWIDTTTTPAIHKVRNATNDGWLAVGLADGEPGGAIPVNIALIALSSNASFAVPSAVTEWSALYRRFFDLTNATQARFIVRTNLAAAAGARMAIQYSTDGSIWAYLDGVDGPFVAVDVAGSMQVGAWVDLAPAAKADVHLRMVGSGGNGSTSLTTASVNLQVRS